MADVNVNAPTGQAPIMAPPVHTDDEILPRIRWFWDTVQYDKSAGCYKCRLDEQWFGLTKDTLREALQITPVNNNQAFISPSSSDVLINFVNELGYPNFRGSTSSTQDLTSTHMPNKEPVLGYLKFSAKGTKREVFGMPIPGNLITSDIQEASYYQEYLAKVAKHRRYLAGETGSDPDSPAPKPTKTTRKPKPKAPKADPSYKIQTWLCIQKMQAHQHSEAEDVPEKEPQVGDEEDDLQRALEERMKSLYDVPRGPLPPVVIREPESGNINRSQSCRERAKQRRTSTPTRSSGHDESSYAKLGLTDSEEESKEDVPRADAGGQGQAGPDPGNAKTSQPMPSPVVHAGSDREHMDLDVADVSPQPTHEQMDEGFTVTDFLKVQENLKLTVEEHVLLEELASSLGTLSSLQHLSKDLSFGDLFFSDKPSEADNDKATAETEVKSMVSITIQQDMSLIPPMTSPIIDLTSRPESPKVYQQLKATAIEKTTATTTTSLPPPYQQQQSTTDAMMMKRIGDLEHIMANLIQENKKLEQRDLPEADMKEILHQSMWETDSYKSHKDHMQLYKALEKSMNHDHSEELVKDLAEARKKKKKRSPGASGSSQVPPPPPPPPSTNQESQSKGFAAPSSSKMADIAPDERAHSSDDEDIGSAHIPKVNLQQDWWKPLEEERPATLKPAWSIPSFDVPVLTNNWASTLASNYLPPLEDSLLAQTECHKLLTDSVDDSILRYNVSKPLPLGGPPGQIIIQSDFFFNKDLEYLRYDSKGSRHALSISKIKVAYYHDVGLEQMVPDQIWIDEECNAVKTHMRILSVFRIKVFSMYGYDYMKKIVLCRTDLNEHVIAERDFKYLYPSDFEDLYLLNLQGHLNHLLPKYKKILTTADAMGFEYKHDYTVIDSLRAVTFWDNYKVQMMMCFNEIHKFSDGTLKQTDEELDYRVKEFKINRMNPGLNTRFWTRKDVDRARRSCSPFRSG
uniref:Histone deacetylase 14 n=1 Tax=Tanacetum cinerariifolium TaxID=118510 RepID=A0A699H0M7_TANCI|nr:histone deacetylase 14 [Tanacetum cinerariifolium]